jgi:hypothetical protein
MRFLTERGTVTISIGADADHANKLLMRQPAVAKRREAKLVAKAGSTRMARQPTTTVPYYFP